MKDTISIEFETDKKEIFNSSDELIKRIKDIDKIYQDRETLAVFIEKLNGEILSMTLGADRTIIGYYPADYSLTGTGSMHSINDSNNNEELTTYYSFGHFTEGFKKWEIDKAIAMVALKDFIENEGLPKLIEWEDD
ncbi:MAG: hypothetical protein P1P88_14025 [Bacteroidales bacterium]|nr:hypothetical protein [Bacteroidales bacterium]